MSQSLADHLRGLLRSSDEQLLREGSRFSSNLWDYSCPLTPACSSYFYELGQDLWLAHDIYRSTLEWFQNALRSWGHDGHHVEFIRATFEHLQEAPEDMWDRLPCLTRLVESTAAGQLAVATCEGESEEELFEAWKAGMIAYRLKHLRQTLTEFLQLLEAEGEG